MTPADTLRAAAARIRSTVAAMTDSSAMHPWGDRSLPQLTVEQIPDEMRGHLGGTWGEAAALLANPVFAGLIIDVLEREADVWDEAAAQLPAEAVAAVLAAPSCVTFTALAQHVIQEQS